MGGMASVAIMGSVVGCEGDGELTICARLAQAPADHLLRWQEKWVRRWKWGFGDGCRIHRRPLRPGWREGVSGGFSGSFSPGSCASRTGWLAIGGPRGLLSVRCGGLGSPLSRACQVVRSSLWGLWCLLRAGGVSASCVVGCHGCLSMVHGVEGGGRLWWSLWRSALLLWSGAHVVCWVRVLLTSVIGKSGCILCWSLVAGVKPPVFSVFCGPPCRMV